MSGPENSVLLIETVRGMLRMVLKEGLVGLDEEDAADEAAAEEKNEAEEEEEAEEEDSYEVRVPCLRSTSRRRRGRGDGVFMRPRRLDAVDARESRDTPSTRATPRRRRKKKRRTRRRPSPSPSTRAGSARK